MDKGIWGFTKQLNEGIDELIGRGTILLYGVNYNHPEKGANPRVLDTEYHGGTMDSVTIAVVKDSVYTDDEEFVWPDEEEDGVVKYRYRVPISVIGELDELVLADYPIEGSSGFRVR